MNDAAIPSLAKGNSNFESRTFAKVTWRLIPLLFICYVVAYLDRVNVGFAKLQMLNDLKFSETVYGLGAGVFFVGYFLFEVPSNLLLYRVGARRWIARIMITWGLISSAMMFVTTPWMFYTLRFMLGVAEAGFFPGIVLYLTYWFPLHRRGRMNALFMAAIPLAGVIGGPLSGWILQSFSGVNGWNGWQWLFLLEGLPTVFIGIVVLFYLDDSVQEASWLSDGEKALIASALKAEEAGKEGHSFVEGLRNGKVWVLSAIYFGVIMGLYGVSFWLPSLIRATGVSGALDVGLLSAIPYAVSAVAMLFVARSADARHELRWHVAVPAILGAAGLALATLFSHSTGFALLALTLACVGIMSCLPVFWNLPTGFLGGAAAAGGIALINSVGNLAGFVSPYMVGLIKDISGSSNIAMYLLAACMLVSAFLVISSIPAFFKKP